MGETEALRIGLGPVSRLPVNHQHCARSKRNMGLDKDDPTPPVDLKKRTTKVNIWMVIAILVFFAVAGAVLLFTQQNPPTPSATKGADETVEPAGK